MRTYLAQIADRNFSSEQPMLRPIPPIFQVGLGEDPFERTDVADIERRPATKETPGLSHENITIERKSHQEVPTETGKMADVNPTLQPGNLKPPYLTKYIERSQYINREQTRELKEAGLVAGSENKRSETAAPRSLHQSEKGIAEHVMKNQVTPPVSIDQSPQSEVYIGKPLPKNNIALSKKQATKEKLPMDMLPASIISTQKSTRYLQPNSPASGYGPVQKEKTAPSLIIGKITVEVLPAQKPVTKIINQVVKPQPVTNQPSKFSFGLGQL